MSAGKTDWSRHKAIYAEEYAPKGVSIAEYAEMNGLNKNTARRYLRSGDQQRDQQGDQLGDHTRDHASDQVTDHQSRKTRKPSPGAASRATRNGSGKATARKATAKGKEAESGDHADDLSGFIPAARRRMTRPQAKVPLKVMRRVRSTGSNPSSQPITHGGYAEAPDAVWDSALEIPDDEIDFWNLRGAMVSLINIARRRRDVEEFYSSAPVPSEDSDDPVPPPEVQLLKTVCSGVDLEIMLRGFIQKQQQQEFQNQVRLEELEFKRQDRERQELIRKQVFEILSRRDKEDMSAGYACRLIERIGGVVPATLLREFDHELKSEPPDEGKGASLSDFEKDVAEYRAKQLAAEEQVPKRRSAVLQLAQSMGFGDNAEDNASMLSVAFTEDDDDEEWEDEDEAQQYNDMGVDLDVDSERDDAEPEDGF